MKITREGRAIAQFAGLGGDPELPPGSVPPPDCCDVGETPPDRGTDGNAQSPTTATLAFVQTKEHDNDNTDATIAVTLDAPATIGNLLIATYTARTGNPDVAATTPSGWTKFPNPFYGDDPDNGTSVIYYKTADTTDPTLTITKGESVYAHLVVSEFAGNLSLDVYDTGAEIAAATSLTTDAVTPTGTNVLLYAAFNQSARTATYTWTGSFTELAEENVFTSGPSTTSGYRLVTGASGSYAATVTSDESDTYGWAILAFTATATAWAIPQPNVLDGDDATYATIVGADVLRVDLGGAFRIVRSRLRIACENAGSKTYTIKGANLADFSDEVTLATVTFTGTGSFTAQDVEFLWATTESYRYFELTGTSETRRIHTWELFEATPGEIIVEDPTASGALDDLQDVIDNLYGAIGTPSLALDDLTDVDAPTPSDGEVLTWVDADSEWQAQPSAGGGDTFGDLGWFNVEDYGAVHDGTWSTPGTDDTTAIQDAIDACAAAGGGTIYFPMNADHSRTFYQIDGALQDTSTYNSQLKIPQRNVVRADGAVVIRFLGASPGYTNYENATGVTLRSSWDGTISGNPAIISLGLHDSLTQNWTILHFEDIELRAHADPKLTAVDATKGGGVRFKNFTVSVQWASDFEIPLPGDWTVPSHSNAIGVDFPRGYSDLYSGGDGLNVQGYYTGFRPGEQFTALGVTIGFCRQAVDFHGEVDTGGLKRHMAYIGRLETFFCPRGIVFSGDESWVNIGVLGVEDETDVDASWGKVYDIDDASNYGRGFIGWHTTEWTDGPLDSLVVNGGTGLSLYGAFAKRWQLASVVDIPTGTNPSTNPTSGRRIYADSSTGNLTVRKPDGSTVDLEAAGDIDAEDVDYDNATSGLTATDVQAAIDELASAGADAGLIQVDAGAVAYDTSTPGELGITVTSDWGVDAGVAYYDDAGASAGEEAALFWDPSTSQYTVIAYDF